MNISEAAKQSGLPARTIRYYEDIGLVKANRASNGYRHYASSHIHKLRFLQRARSLGFSIEECRTLLSLYEDQRRTSADVKQLALAKIDQIEQKITELESLRGTLAALATACHGDGRPECPILEDIAGIPEHLRG